WGAVMKQVSFSFSRRDLERLVIPSKSVTPRWSQVNTCLPRKAGSPRDWRKAVISGRVSDFKSVMDRSSIPRHAADVKAVGAVAVGPQSHLALGLPHRSGQGEGRAAKVRVLCQEAVGYTLVLLRQDRAGGVHQRAAGPHVPGGVVQDRPLDHRQGEQVVRLFVPDIRLLPDDAETRAGGVYQHHIEPRLPLRPEPPAVCGGSLDARKAQSLRPLPDALQ
ncbi:5'-nucleotidase, partial [Dysosmobacter welbionis]